MTRQKSSSPVQPLDNIQDNLLMNTNFVYTNIVQDSANFVDGGKLGGRTL